jgi:Mrp family chromosome partitioning ATPase
MEELVANVRRRSFDLVIFDTPPVLPVTDATLVGALADGALLCLRAGKVLRDDALTCKNRLRLADVKVLGTVFNAVLPQTRYGRGYQPYEEYISSTQGRSGAA